MKYSNEKKPVQDYWKFTRDLRAQLKAVESMKRMFFELDDMCESAIRNDISVLSDNGERVNLVDDCLAAEQLEWYHKLRKAVKDLDTMLADGEVCFIKKEDKKDE